MNRKYRRAHPKSELGSHFTNAHKHGWELVCFNPEGYPIFRETRIQWFRRVILKRKDYCVAE